MSIKKLRLEVSSLKDDNASQLKQNEAQAAEIRSLEATNAKLQQQIFEDNSESDEKPVPTGQLS